MAEQYSTLFFGLQAVYKNISRIHKFILMHTKWRQTLSTVSDIVHRNVKKNPTNPPYYKFI